MSNLQINGTQKFMGRKIPVVLGGFGADKKCICDKTIAEIHNQPEREIRRRITENIKRFRENVDYIDLAQREGDSHTLIFLQDLGYSKQAITQAEHIYILSERGYAKLIKIMDTDLAWEIHDSLIDEYFALRQTGTYVVQSRMEQRRQAGEAASLLKQLDRIARDKLCSPQERSEIAYSLCGQLGIALPQCFIRKPAFEQVTFMVRK